MNNDKFEILRRILSAKALVPESEIRRDSDLFTELDIDSLCLVEAFVEIEKQFHVSLHPGTMPKGDINTPEKLLALIFQSCP